MVITVMAAVSGMVIPCDAPVLEESSQLLMHYTPFLIYANFSEVFTLLRFAVCAARKFLLGLLSVCETYDSDLL